MTSGIISVNAPRHYAACDRLFVPATRAEQRWLSFLDQLRQEHADKSDGSDRGWQTAAAKWLKIPQPMLSKYVNGERGVGLDTLEHVIRKCGISPAFFFGSFASPPHYRDFMGVRKLPPPMGYAAYHKFVAEAASLGCGSVTEAERHALQAQDWATEPTVAAYMHLLFALRACAPVEDTKAKRRDLVRRV